MNRPKRKYTRRKGLPKTVKTQRIPLHGLQFTLSEDFVKKVTTEQQERTETEFQESVLHKFKRWIEELTENPDDMEELENPKLPTDVGQSSAEYSRELSRDFVFLPQGDFSLRCHVGLMLLMGWAVKEILRREKELAQLKSHPPRLPLQDNSSKEREVF